MVNLRVKVSDKKKYYYLEHTIRKGKSFTNKRKYLGTQMPKDLETLKEKFMYELFFERYNKALETIKKKFSLDFSKYPISAKKSISNRS